MFKTRIIWSIMLILSAVGSLSAKTETFTLTFSESDFAFETDSLGRLSITPKELHILPEPDRPALPILARTIGLTAGQKYRNSSISSNKRLIKSNVIIATAPEPVPSNGRIKTPQATDITYDTNTVYPTNNCEYQFSNSWSDVEVLHYCVTPFEYNAETKQLFFIDSMELSINVEDSLQPKLVARSSAKTTANQAPGYVKESLFNADEFAETYTDSAIGLQKVNALAESDNEQIHYLIVTADSLVSSFEPLRIWKLQKGLYAKTVTTKEIFSKYTEGTQVLKIKKYLYDLYLNNGLKYVLLGGDDTIVPVQKTYCFSYFFGGKGFRNDIPADMFYANFEGNFEWNANKNDYHGELDDSVYYSQQIIITRAPIRCNKTASIFVNRILDYEKNPRYNNKMLLSGACHILKNNANISDADCQSDVLYAEGIKPYWRGKKYKLFDTSSDFEGGANYDFNAQNLANQISQGYNFISVSTHGGPTGWRMEDDNLYDTSHSINQVNPVHTIITSAACLTNSFDDIEDGEDYDHTDPCLSESFIRNPGSGVIAYWGCSRDSWFLGSFKSLGASLQYERAFYTELFSNPRQDKHFGEISSRAKYQLSSFCKKDSEKRWCQYGINPMGDPEMPIFVAKPLNMFSSCVEYSNGKLTVWGSQSDSRICVMSSLDNGKSYYKVFNPAKSVSLPDMPEYASVCITRQGFIPKHYKIRIIQGGDYFYSPRTVEADAVILGSSVTSSIHTGMCHIVNAIISAPTVIITDGVEVKRQGSFTISNQ